MKYLAVLLLGVSLAGCQSLGTPTAANRVVDDLPQNLSTAQLLANGQAALQQQSWSAAIKYFDVLQQRAPESPEAVQSHLDEAFAYFKQGDTQRADEVLAQFVRDNPGHSRTDYALYLKALLEMEQPPNPLERVAGRFVTINPAERDQQGMEEAYLALQTLLSRYPQSPYAADARVRIHVLYNRLAEREIIVARHYAEREAWLSAVNRANYVLENFASSESVDEALAIQIKAYQALGMTDLASNAQRLLTQRFPSSPYVSDPALALKKPRRLST